jgi:hypothetical protein
VTTQQKQAAGMLGHVKMWAHYTVILLKYQGLFYDFLEYVSE